MKLSLVVRSVVFVAAAILPCAAAAAQTPVQIAQANGYGPYGGYAGGGYDEHRGRAVGVVAYFAGYNLDLENGPHVNLHHGTVINPTGATLRRGMQIAVRGYRNRDGSINADVIDILGYRRHDRY